MKEIVSGRIRKLSDSQTLAMNQKSSDLQAKGVDIINLSVGEPDFHTPPHIKEAAKKAIDDNFSFYSPAGGYLDLKQAIVKKLQNENKLDYSPSNIIVSSGAKHSIANALMVLVDEGDDVIVPAPYWVSYVELVKLSGGNNIILESSADNNFKVTPSQIEDAITPKTKVLLLCSPNNPSGSVYTRDELSDFVEILNRYPDIFIISDEIYEHINFVGKHESIASFKEIKDRVVLVNGVSKAFAMTGWRIGYMAAAEIIIKACSKLQGQFTSGPSSIAQKAAIAALTGDMSYTWKMREAFRRRRDLVTERAGKIKGMNVSKPEGAFYLFPEISHFKGMKYEGGVIESGNDFCMFLLEHAHVAAVPGEAFGSPFHVRISYAASDAKLNDAFDRIEHALEKLK
ncbi:MAG: pyridoxal phosphate-dependent aminotransferase [Marinilabiliales bacterium]|nr:MAG: pyridoxal phosphate-dependent aminotransferase [Marinilabiliales bacterium]